MHFAALAVAVGVLAAHGGGHSEWLAFEHYTTAVWPPYDPVEGSEVRVVLGGALGNGTAVGTFNITRNAVGDEVELRVYAYDEVSKRYDCEAYAAARAGDGAGLGYTTSYAGMERDTPVGSDLSPTASVTFTAPWRGWQGGVPWIVCFRHTPEPLAVNQTLFNATAKWQLVTTQGFYSFEATAGALPQETFFWNSQASNLRAALTDPSAAQFIVAKITSRNATTAWDFRTPGNTCARYLPDDYAACVAHDQLKVVPKNTPCTQEPYPPPIVADTTPANASVNGSNATNASVSNMSSLFANRTFEAYPGSGLVAGAGNGTWLEEAWGRLAYGVTYGGMALLRGVSTAHPLRDAATAATIVPDGDGLRTMYAFLRLPLTPGSYEVCLSTAGAREALLAEHAAYKASAAETTRPTPATIPVWQKLPITTYTTASPASTGGTASSDAAPVNATRTATTAGAVDVPVESLTWSMNDIVLGTTGTLSVYGAGLSRRGGRLNDTEYYFVGADGEAGLRGVDVGDAGMVGYTPSHGDALRLVPAGIFDDGLAQQLRVGGGGGTEDLAAADTAGIPAGMALSPVAAVGCWAADDDARTAEALHAEPVASANLTHDFEPSLYPREYYDTTPVGDSLRAVLAVHHVQAEVDNVGSAYAVVATGTNVTAPPRFVCYRKGRSGDGAGWRVVPWGGATPREGRPRVTIALPGNADGRDAVAAGITPTPPAVLRPVVPQDATTTLSLTSDAVNIPAAVGYITAAPRRGEWGPIWLVDGSGANTTVLSAHNATLATRRLSTSAEAGDPGAVVGTPFYTDADGDIRIVPSAMPCASFAYVAAPEDVMPAASARPSDRWYTASALTEADVIPAPHHPLSREIAAVATGLAGMPGISQSVRDLDLVALSYLGHPPYPRYIQYPSVAGTYAVCFRIGGGNWRRSDSPLTIADRPDVNVRLTGTRAGGGVAAIIEETPVVVLTPAGAGAGNASANGSVNGSSGGNATANATANDTAPAGGRVFSEASTFRVVVNHALCLTEDLSALTYPKRYCGGPGVGDGCGETLGSIDFTQVANATPPGFRPFQLAMDGRNVSDGVDVTTGFYVALPPTRGAYRGCYRAGDGVNWLAFDDAVVVDPAAVPSVAPTSVGTAAAPLRSAVVYPVELTPTTDDRGILENVTVGDELASAPAVDTFFAARAVACKEYIPDAVHVETRRRAAQRVGSTIETAPTYYTTGPCLDLPAGSAPAPYGSSTTRYAWSPQPVGGMRSLSFNVTLPTVLGTKCFYLCYGEGTGTWQAAGPYWVKEQALTWGHGATGNQGTAYDQQTVDLELLSGETGVQFNTDPVVDGGDTAKIQAAQYACDMDVSVEDAVSITDLGEGDRLTARATLLATLPQGDPTFGTTYRVCVYMRLPELARRAWVEMTSATGSLLTTTSSAVRSWSLSSALLHEGSPTTVLAGLYTAAPAPGLQLVHTVAINGSEFKVVPFTQYGCEAEGVGGVAPHLYPAGGEPQSGFTSPSTLAFHTPAEEGVYVLCYRLAGDTNAPWLGIPSASGVRTLTVRETGQPGFIQEAFIRTHFTSRDVVEAAVQADADGPCDDVGGNVLGWRATSVAATHSSAGLTISTGEGRHSVCVRLNSGLTFRARNLGTTAEGGGSNYFQRGVGADGVHVAVMPIFLDTATTSGRFSVYDSTAALPTAPPVSIGTGFRSYSHVPTDRKLRVSVSLTLQNNIVPFGDGVAYIVPCAAVAGVQDLVCRETEFVGAAPYVLKGALCHDLAQGAAFFEVEYVTACPSGIFGCGFVIKVIHQDYLFTSRPVWANVEARHPDTLYIEDRATCLDAENCTFALQAVYKQAFESAALGDYRVQVFYDTKLVNLFKPSILGTIPPLPEYPNGTRAGARDWGAGGAGMVDFFPVLTTAASTTVRFKVVCEGGATKEASVAIVPRTIAALAIMDIIPEDLRNGELRSSRDAAASAVYHAVPQPSYGVGDSAKGPTPSPPGGTFAATNANANGYLEAGVPYMVVFTAALPSRAAVAGEAGAVEAIPATLADLNAYTVKMELLAGNGSSVVDGAAGETPAGQGSNANATGGGGAADIEAQATVTPHPILKNALLPPDRVTFELLSEELATRALTTTQRARAYGTGVGVFEARVRVLNNLGCGRFNPCTLRATLVHDTLPGVTISDDVQIATRVRGTTFEVHAEAKKAEMRNGLPVTLLPGTPSIDGFLVDEYHTGTVFGWMSTPLPMGGEANRDGVTARGPARDGVHCERIFFNNPETGVAEVSWGARFTFFTSRPCLECEVTFHSTDGLGPDPGTAGDGSDDYGALAFTLFPDATGITCSSIPDVYFYTAKTSSTMSLTVTAINAYLQPVGWGSWQVDLQMSSESGQGITLNGVLSGPMENGAITFKGVTMSGVTGETRLTLNAVARTQVYDATARGAVVKEIVAKTCQAEVSVRQFEEPLEPPPMRVRILRDSDNCPDDNEKPCYLTATTSSLLRLNIPFEIDTVREGEGWFRDVRPRNATLGYPGAEPGEREFVNGYTCTREGLGQLCTSGAFPIASRYTANNRVNEAGDSVRLTYGTPMLIASTTFAPDQFGNPRTTVIENGYGEMALLLQGNGVQVSPVREGRFFLCVLDRIMNIEKGFATENFMRVCREIVLTLTPHTPPAYQLLLLRTGKTPVEQNVVLVPGVEDACGASADSIEFLIVVVYRWATALDPDIYFIDYRSTVDVHVTTDAVGQILVDEADLQLFGATLRYTLRPAVAGSSGEDYGRRISFYGREIAVGHFLASSPGVAGLRSARAYTWAMVDDPGVSVTVGTPTNDDGCYHGGLRPKTRGGYLDYQPVPGKDWVLERDGAVAGVAFPLQVRVRTAAGGRAYTHPASRVKVSIERSPSCEGDTRVADYSIYYLRGRTLQASDLFTEHGQITMWVVVNGVCDRCRVVATVCYADAATVGTCLSPPGGELPLMSARMARTGYFEVRPAASAAIGYGIRSQHFPEITDARGGYLTGERMEIVVAPVVHLPAGWVDADAPVPADLYTSLTNRHDLAYRSWYDTLRRSREALRKTHHATQGAHIDNPPPPPPTLSIVWADSSENAVKYGNGGFVRLGKGDCGMSDVTAVPSRLLKGYVKDADADARSVTYSFSFTRPCARCVLHMQHYDARGMIAAEYPVRVGGRADGAVQEFTVNTCGLQWLFYAPQPAALKARAFSTALLRADLNGVPALTGDATVEVKTGTRGGNGYGGTPLIEKWPGAVARGSGAAIVRARFPRACWTCELRAGYRVREVAVVSVPRYFLVMNASLSAVGFSEAEPTATLQLMGYLADEHGDRAASSGGPSLLNWQRARSRQKAPAGVLTAVGENAVPLLRAVRGPVLVQQAVVINDIPNTRPVRPVQVNEGTPLTSLSIVIEGPARNYVPRVTVDGRAVELVTVGLAPLPPINFPIAPSVLLMGDDAQVMAASGALILIPIRLVGETFMAGDEEGGGEMDLRTTAPVPGPTDVEDGRVIKTYTTAVASLKRYSKRQRTVALEIACNACPECTPSGDTEVTLDGDGRATAELSVVGAGSCEVIASPPAAGPLAGVARGFVEVVVRPPTPDTWLWSSTGTIRVDAAGGVNISGTPALISASTAGQESFLTLVPYDSVTGELSSLETSDVLVEDGLSIASVDMEPEGCATQTSVTASDGRITFGVRFNRIGQCRIKGVRGLPEGMRVLKPLEVTVERVASMRVIARTHFSGVSQNLTGLTVPDGARAGVAVFAAQAGQPVALELETLAAGGTQRVLGDMATPVAWQLRRFAYDPSIQARRVQTITLAGTMYAGHLRLTLNPPHDTRPLDCCVENCGACVQCCTIQRNAAHVPFDMSLSAVIEGETRVIDLGQLTIVSLPVAARVVLEDDRGGVHSFLPYQLSARADVHPRSYPPLLEGFSVSMVIVPLDRPVASDPLTRFGTGIRPAWVGVDGEGASSSAVAAATDVLDVIRGAGRPRPQVTTHTLGPWVNLPIRLHREHFMESEPYLVLHFASVPPCRARVVQSGISSDPSGIDLLPIVDNDGTCSSAGGGCKLGVPTPTCATGEVLLPDVEATAIGGVVVGRPGAAAKPDMRLLLDANGYIRLDRIMSTVAAVHPFYVTGDRGGVFASSALHVEKLRRVDLVSYAGGLVPSKAPVAAAQCAPASSLTDAEFFRPYGGRSTLIPEPGDTTTWAWPRGFVCPMPETNGVGFTPSSDGSGVLFVRPGEMLDVVMVMYVAQGSQKNLVPLGSTPHTYVELEIFCETGGSLTDDDVAFAVRYLRPDGRGGFARESHVVDRRPVVDGKAAWYNVSFEGRCPFTHILLRSFTDPPPTPPGGFPAIADDNGARGYVARVPIFRVLQPRQQTDLPATAIPPSPTQAPMQLPTAQLAIFNTLFQPVLDLFAVAYEADVFADPRIDVPGVVHLRWMCSVPTATWFATHTRSGTNSSGGSTALNRVPTVTNDDGDEEVRGAPLFITDAMKDDSSICEGFDADGTAMGRRKSTWLQQQPVATGVPGTTAAPAGEAGDAAGGVTGNVIVVEFAMEWLITGPAAGTAPSPATLYRVLDDLTSDATSSFHTLLGAQGNARVTSWLSLPNGTVLDPPAPPGALDGAPAEVDGNATTTQRGVAIWDAGETARPAWAVTLCGVAVTAVLALLH